MVIPFAVVVSVLAAIGQGKGSEGVVARQFANGNCGLVQFAMLRGHAGNCLIEAGGLYDRYCLPINRSSSLQPRLVSLYCLS